MPFRYPTDGCSVILPLPHSFIGAKVDRIGSLIAGLSSRLRIVLGNDFFEARLHTAPTDLAFAVRAEVELVFAHPPHPDFLPAIAEFVREYHPRSCEPHLLRVPLPTKCPRCQYTGRGRWAVLSDATPYDAALPCPKCRYWPV